MQKYALINICGADAKKFLQGQLTCDMEQISPTKGSLGAHCNPQGRVISFFYLFMQDQAYYLLMPDSLTAIALQALKKYAVFFKVQLKEENNTFLSTLPSAIHEQFNIQHGIPRIYPETSGQFLPHELNLDKLGALSFNKGCYTGQEIIARMQHRAKIKKRLYLTQLKSERKPLPGEDIFYLPPAGEEAKICGNIVDIEFLKNNHYLALVITDEQHAKNNTVFINANNNFFDFEDLSI